MANKVRLSLNRALRHFREFTDDVQRTLKPADDSKLDDLLKGASEVGLESDDIAMLISLICSGRVRKTKFRKVMKCLLPRHGVPMGAVLDILGWVTENATEDGYSDVVLQWLVGVFEFLDDPEILHRAYFVFFQYLQFERLRYNAAILLSLLTKQEDVLAFRITRLVKLRRKLGNEKSIISILSQYRNFSPHLVTVSLPNSKLLQPRSSWWAKAIQDLKTRNVIVPGNITFKNPKTFWELEDHIVMSHPNQPRKKIRREEYLPSVQPETNFFDRQNTNSGDGQSLVGLSTISSHGQLIDCIERIKTPSLSFTILRYPVLQHIISTCNDTGFATRFSYRLNDILFQDFASISAASDAALNRVFLNALSQFSEIIHEGNPVVDNFLQYYMTYIWNGRNYLGLILKLITRFAIRDIKDFDGVFVPIKRLFCSSEVKLKLTILETFHSLLQNYMAREIHREDYNFKAFDSFFIHDTEYLDADQAIYDFLHYVGELCILGLLLENENSAILHVALDFYLLATTLPLKHEVYILTIAPRILVYSAFTSLDPYVLSKVCLLLCSWKEAYKKFKDTCTERKELTFADRGGTNNVIQKSYERDLIDGLFGGNAFNTSNQSSAFDVPADVLESLNVSDDNISHAFSILRHPAMINIVLNYHREHLPDEPDFFTKSLLASHSKNDFCRYLDGIGLIGISKFLKTFIKL